MKHINSLSFGKHLVMEQELLALLHDWWRQEAASMLPILVLDPQENERLLDLCAAPGSKATHAAERMAPSGMVVANDNLWSRQHARQQPWTTVAPQ